LEDATSRNIESADNWRTEQVLTLSLSPVYNVVGVVKSFYRIPPPSRAGSGVKGGSTLFVEPFIASKFPWAKQSILICPFPRFSKATIQNARMVF
jgi:hypothetical protein